MQVPMADPINTEIRLRIMNAQRILVVSHVRPDGDAIGSLLGLGLAIQTSGKLVEMVLDDTVPANLRHLPGYQQVSQRPKDTCDLIVTLDCSDLKRVGKALNGYNVPDVNIDHHPTNLNFGKINLVDPSAVATAEILTRSLPEWDLPITKDVASALLTALVTDTLGFRTSNVTSKVMRMAADLMDVGADLPDIYGKSLIQRSFEATRFWGAGLTQLQREGPVVWSILTTQDRKASGYSGNDDADLINVLSAIKDAMVAIVFVEQSNGNIKVSWRAQPGVDVAQIASSFGGGGHTAAAGAEIQGTLDDVRSRVIGKTRDFLV
jgi:phosphoesterase RecJ-like protein